MKKLKLEDINWNTVFDSADELLKKYNIPHRVSRSQKEIYCNEPLCFVILPYSWDKQVLEDLRSIPGVKERRAFNTEKGRYRKFVIYKECKNE